MNPSDTKSRGGWGGIEQKFERIIPHQDGAGVIESVGENVDKSRIGERVWIYEAQLGRAFGTGAEYVVIPSEKAINLPDNTSFAEGACLGVPRNDCPSRSFRRRCGKRTNDSRNWGSGCCG